MKSLLNSVVSAVMSCAAELCFLPETRTISSKIRNLRFPSVQDKSEWTLTKSTHAGDTHFSVKHRNVAAENS